MNAKTLFAALVMMLAILQTPGLSAPKSTPPAEKNYIYKTDFSADMNGWTGRDGYGDRPRLEIVNHPDAQGKAVLKIMTNGTLGCGLQFTVPVDIVPGKEYKLSFKLRCSSSTSLTARITQNDFADNGEDVPGWFGIPEEGQSPWRSVEHSFSPTSASIGLEIGVNSKSYEPFELLLSDLTIEAL